MKLIAIFSFALAYAFTQGMGSYNYHGVAHTQGSSANILFADTTKLDGLWFLQPVLPPDTGFMKTPSLKVDPGKKMVSGNNGCNTFTGSFSYSDTSISFNKNMATTRMACIGYDESAFMRNLQRVDRYKLKDGMLTLLEGATEISRWARKPATKPVIREASR